MKKTWIGLIFIFLFIITSCQSVFKPSNTNELFLPSSGKSIIFGKLIYDNNEPHAGLVVRLAEVYQDENGRGAFVLDDAHSPKTITDKNGVFTFNDIPPGEYVLFVGELNSNYEVISDINNTPIIYSVTSDEALELEPLIIEFEND